MIADDEPRLRLVREGEQGVPMSEEEKAAERERERNIRHGKWYWCVGLADGTEIHAHADELQFYDGGLQLERETGEGRSVNMAFAPGHWRFVYAASVIDGRAVALEHWVVPQDNRRK